MRLILLAVRVGDNLRTPSSPVNASQKIGKHGGVRVRVCERERENNFLATF